jgi:glycosyltransferase involved in cell wall biosynthesis
LRICLIGKFPPIEGGVSTRTYWTAHALAALGHEVHVVTNANEVRPPFRMHMRPEDWQRCEAVYGAGSVTVHWTEPVNSSQFYIPMANPFISKLATQAAQTHAEHRLDVIMSYYIEPYGMAGHLAAQMTGAPHVVRMAGSDAGRLWHNPQLGTVYNHVLRSAETVLLSGAVATRAVQCGIERTRIVSGGDFIVPENVFTPFSPALSLPAWARDFECDPDLSSDLLWGELAAGMPYFGIYGKLSKSKGAFALLSAMHKLKQEGLEVGLAVMAHGEREVERRFRTRARKLGLVDRVLQIPFLPNWRVPEFVRGCLAVCCLEQSFPISFHTPISPREVLLCGACLVGSTEIIRKLPGYPQLPDGYGCVAIANAEDVEAVSRRLGAIVRDPEPVTSIGARGYAFAHGLQQEIAFPQELEHILESAAARQRRRATATQPRDDDRFPLTRLALKEVDAGLRGQNEALLSIMIGQPIDTARAREVLNALGRAVEAGRGDLHSLALGVRIETEIAAAEDEAGEPGIEDDQLFRLHLRRWALGEEALAELVPVRAPNLRIVEFEYDVSQFLGVSTAEQLPTRPTRRQSYIVAFARSLRPRRDPLLVDGVTVRILQLSDGIRTVSEIVEELGRAAILTRAMRDPTIWLETLFVRGLLWLSDCPWQQRPTAALS